MADITQTAAVIGAVTGVINSLYQYFSNRESIHVGFGSLRADELETDSMYVLNQSKFDVELKDYGFVIRGGELFSIPLYAEIEVITCDDGFFQKGEPRIPPRGIFRTGIDCSKTVVGAYAITAAQAFPVVTIGTRASILQRIAWILKAKFFYNLAN